MKIVSFLIACLSFSYASAAPNFNHLACIYNLDQSGWHFWSHTSSPDNYSLASGQSRFLSGLWTSDKPVLPNYAACTTMIGTGDENNAIVMNYVYQANQFDALDGNDQCSVSGENVKIVSKSEQLVSRGSFSILETDWISPDASKIQIREYVPKVDELDKLNEIAVEKCNEIAPGK